MSQKFSIGEEEIAGLRSLQKKVADLRTARGFTQDPERVLLLLVEEVGEVAQQLKRTWSPNYDSYTNEAIAEELADVQFVLLGLAELLGVDLGASMKKKTAKDAERKWTAVERCEDFDDGCGLQEGRQ
jgi:NTP pyrophosphatase (non-canonical NTP hydrolase)